MVHKLVHNVQESLSNNTASMQHINKSGQYGIAFITHLRRNMAHFLKPSHLLLFVFFLSLLQSILLTRPEGEALVKWKNSLAPSSFLDSPISMIFVTGLALLVTLQVQSLRLTFMRNNLMECCPSLVSLHFQISTISPSHTTSSRVQYHQQLRI